MSEETLEQFLRRKKQVSVVTPRIAKMLRKKAWLDSLNRLMSTVREWLAPLQKEGIIDVTLETRVLEENLIGKYEVPSLTLTVGSEKVRFEPRGTLVVGAWGRVDVVGALGEETLILDERTWHVVVSRTPRRRVVPLTKESLHDVLARVMKR